MHNPATVQSGSIDLKQYQSIDMQDYISNCRNELLLLSTYIISQFKL